MLYLIIIGLLLFNRNFFIMKLLKVYSISFLFLFSIFFANPIFAEEKTTEKNAPLVESVLLADINVRDSKIISQEGNTFKISFSISNGLEIQTGVKYGLELVKISGDNRFVVDEKVYDESLTIAENTTINKEIIYTAPNTLNGKYKLFILVKNENSFPFGSGFLGEVNISNEISGIQILDESCKISNSGKDYNLYETINVLPTDTLRLTCNVLNNSKNKIEFTPFFSTKVGTVYGKEVDVESLKIDSLTLDPEKTKTFSFIIPKPTIPQIYHVSLSLKSDQTYSNHVNFNYVFRGTIATIYSLSLDKDFYKKGDTSKLYVFWTYMPEGNSKNNEVTMNASVKNSKGEECSDPYSQVLVKDYKNPKTEIPILVNRSCIDPSILVTLKDNSGNILDQKIFNVKTNLNKDNSISLIILILVLILILIGLFYYLNKRKNIFSKKDIDSLNEKSNPIKIILPLLILTSLFSFIPTNSASAATYTISYGTGTGSCTGYYEVGLNKTTFVQGEPITATGSMSGTCGEGYGTNMKMTVNTAEAPTLKHVLLNSNGGTNSKILFGRTMPGSSQVNFEVYFGNNSGFNYYHKGIGYGVNDSGSTTPTTPTTPEVTMKVTDISPDPTTGQPKNILIAQNAQKTISQAIKPATLLQIEYSIEGITKNYNCTEPKSSDYPNGITKLITPTTLPSYRRFKITPSTTTKYEVSCEEALDYIPHEETIDILTTPISLGSQCSPSANSVTEILTVNVEKSTELLQAETDYGNGVTHYTYNVWVTSNNNISNGATVKITGSYLQNPLVDNIAAGTIRFNYCDTLKIPAGSSISNKRSFSSISTPSISVSSSVYNSNNTNPKDRTDTIQ